MGDEPLHPPKGSDPELDAFLSKTLLEHQVLTQEQLRESQREQDEDRRRGRERSLADVLLGRGWLKPDELAGLLETRVDRRSALPNLPRYEFRETVGEGASAIVYRAWDRELQRLVAIKVLREGAALSTVSRDRFRREAQAAAKLIHPCVVTVYDAGEHKGCLYQVMELIVGRPLSELLPCGPSQRRGLVQALEKAARGVALAHEKGVVHRDLKPPNILVTDAGEPKVADFGLAHLMDSDNALTRTGAKLGTPYYMAPEQVEGRAGQVTPATDVYALGAILYEILTGRVPHEAGSLTEVFAAILSRDPIPPRAIHPGIPRDLETITLKALEKDPARRYPSAGAFADDLARAREGEPIRAVPASAWDRWGRKVRKNPALAAAAGLALLVTGAAAVTLRVQDARARRTLEEEQENARQRQRALQRLSTLAMTLSERKGELRGLRIPIGKAREELAKTILDIDDSVRRWPDFPQGYYVRAQGRRILGDPRGAERDLRTAVEKEPRFGPGWLLLGILKTEEYLQRVPLRMRLTRKRVAELSPLLDEAAACFARGADSGPEWGLPATREEQIASRLRRVCEVYPRGNRRDEATRLLIESDREYQAEEYATWLGLYSGADKERLGWLDKAVERAPGYAPAHYFRGLLKLEKGDAAGATADETRALELDGASAWPYFARAQARILLKDFDGAISDCGAGLEADPDCAELFAMRGLALLEQEKWAEARAEFTRAVARDGTLIEALVNRGKAAQALGDDAAALEDLDRVVALDPGWLEAQHNRGMILWKQKKFPDAIAAFDKAIGIKAGFYPSYFLRAQAKQGTGDLAGAVQDLEETLRLAPPDWTYRAAAVGILRRARAALDAKR